MSEANVRQHDLEGKLALITGASVGIGFATAQELGLRGARVLVTSKEPQRIDRAAQELRDAGVDAQGIAADLAAPDAASHLYERVVSVHGSPDILANCAALRSKIPAVDLTSDVWDRVMTVNLRVPVFLAALACRDMMNRHSGKILNVVSILESRAAPARLPYAASKAGLAAATRCLALEMASYNIQVNAVAPGLVATPALEPANDDEKRQLERTIADRIPVGKVATAVEVAELIGFLCSPSADYITGQVIYIDGGMTLR